jgi:hypothetical protein
MNCVKGQGDDWGYLLPDQKDMCEMDSGNGLGGPFLSGDVRANENPGLQVHIMLRVMLLLKDNQH